MSGLPIPRPPDTAPIGRARLRAACWRGDEPAERLDPDDRDELVGELLAEGWTVTQIAAHTRLTTYTAGRITARLRRKGTTA